MWTRPVSVSGIPYFHVPKGLAEKGHKDAPYAISDQVFWACQGTWQLFSVELREKRVIVKLPAEFVRALGWLAGEGAEDNPDEPKG